MCVFISIAIALNIINETKKFFLYVVYEIIESTKSYYLEFILDVEVSTNKKIQGKNE